MTANLPPQFHNKEAELKTAKTPDEKISILEQMLSIMPKHKSSEKLQAEIKTKISRFKKEKLKVSQTAKHSTVPMVLREGAGQVVICGPPNSGKSTLLASLTNAKPAAAEYPFTTKLPTPGMAKYEDILIQLVDTPCLAKDFSEDWLGSILRNSDILLFLFDLSSDTLLEELEDSFRVLERFKIKEENKLSFTKKILWTGNKIDRDNAPEIKDVFLDLYGEYVPKLFEISAKETINLQQLPQILYSSLDIIRVYTKIPGKPPESKNPYTLKKNSQVIELAGLIHKDLRKTFRYARLWRQGEEKPAIAGRDFLLQEKDVIEIHA